MTQLPEVEVIRKDLEREVVGKRFKDVTVRTASLVSRHRNRPEFVKALVGQRIDAVTRRGTALLLDLDNGTTLVIRVPAQATLTRETATEDPGKTTQVVATFTTGGALHFLDPNKAGELFVVPDEELDEIAELSPSGVDPLASTFTWHSVGQELKDRDVPLKGLLVDESFIVGLGDLYADEILWAAGLAGTRRSATLSSQEVRRLYRAILEVMYEAVKQGGAGETEAEMADPHTESPDMEDYIKVYGREGQPCARCRQPIQWAKIDKRLEQYFCAQCQT